jgi:hypothetical protein
MSRNLEIIIDGDSWVFGCEIVDPILASKYSSDTHPGAYDYVQENDSYRIPKIFPTHLAKIMDADVTNLSWPADDNLTILKRTMNYITNNYIAKNKSLENLFVIIGWSSPERNSFWYKDEKISTPFRLQPQVPHFNSKMQEKIWELYVSYLWNPEEYLTRYVLNVIQFQNFCNAYNIKWLCFNSFYQTPKKNVTEWEDLDIAKELKLINLGRFHLNKTSQSLLRSTEEYNFSNLWDTVDPIRFYKKNEINNTFKSYIEDPKNQIKNVLNGWHPSPESHEAWANELFRYIKENNLNGK